MKDLVTNLKPLVTFIYAFPQKHMQCDLWEEVLKLDPIHSPWCLVGDFNNIVDLSKKVGGNQTHTTDMNNFINFLNRGILLSLNASGVPFTWTNCHTDHTVVFERLDRVVANPLWLNMFRNYHLHNYPIFCSNHSPILVSLNSSEEKNNYFPFKFEAMWLIILSLK